MKPNTNTGGSGGCDYVGCASQDGMKPNFIVLKFEYFDLEVSSSD